MFGAFGTSHPPHLWQQQDCFACGLVVMFFSSAEAESCLSPDKGRQLQSMVYSEGEEDKNAALQSCFPGVAYLILNET